MAGIGKGKSLVRARLLLCYLRGKFLLCPLLSGYQVRRKNRPKFFESIVVEVVWNERQNFGTVAKKLDKF
jgi:hypothetical protein